MSYTSIICLIIQLAYLCFIGYDIYRKIVAYKKYRKQLEEGIQDFYMQRDRVVNEVVCKHFGMKPKAQVLKLVKSD